MTTAILSANPISLSISAISLPPLQYTVSACNRLVHTDALSSTIGLTLPEPVAAIANLMYSGTAINPPIQPSLLTGIATLETNVLSGVSTVLGLLEGAINTVLGGGVLGISITNPIGSLTVLNQITNFLQNSPIQLISNHINDLMTSLPTIAGVMALTNSLAPNVGISLNVNLTTVFKDLLGSYQGSGLAALLTTVQTAMNALVTGLGLGLTGASAAISGLFATVQTAYAAVTTSINGIYANINQSLSVYMHLSNAGVINNLITGVGVISSIAEEFNIFLGQISSSQLAFYLKT